MYAAAVKQRLEQSGWRFVSVIEVPAGEDSKSLETYAGVVRWLARSGLGRDGTLFALGGGVIGDLGGFVRRHLPAGYKLRRVADLPTGDGR